MKNIPERIWLNTGLEKGDEVKNFEELSEVTWCRDKTSNGDIPYERVRRVNMLVVVAWTFAIIIVPFVYLLYVPYTIFKTLADGDEFNYFFQRVTDCMLVPLKRYLKQRKT